MTSLFYPTLGTIELLSREESLEDLTSKYVTDLSGTYLIPKSFFIGRIVTILRDPLEYWGFISVEGGLQTALTTARVALEAFREQLLHPIEEPSSVVQQMLGVSYNTYWLRCFRHVHRLFHPHVSFPEAGEALALFAPRLIEQLAASQIPFESIDRIIDEQELSALQQRALMQWITDLDFVGRTIEQQLLHSTLYFCVGRHHPEFSSFQKLTCTFYLAWRLRRLGLATILDEEALLGDSTHVGSLDIDEAEGIRVGAPLLCSFPLEFPLFAYELRGNAEEMVVCSSLPLSLGMWVYALSRQRSIVPLVRIRHVDHLGRFVITERIDRWFDDPLFWDGPGVASTKNQRIVEELGRLIEDLSKAYVTLDMVPSYLFLTMRGTLRSVKAFPVKYRYSYPPTIEKFVQIVCRNDQERIRAVLQKGNFFTHPTGRAIFQIVDRYHFQATDRQIEAMVRDYRLSSEMTGKIIRWHLDLQNRVRFVFDALGRSPSCASQSAEDRLASLARLFCELQHRMGFMMKVPKDLTEKMLGCCQ